MIEFYPQIKMLHVATVVASGALFLLRGAAVQRGARWAMAGPIRYLSYAIDTVLLASALMLLTVVPAASYENGWLATKLVLLVVYVGFGTYALKRGRTARARLLFFIAALAVYGCMFAIARMHHPLGPWLVLRGLFG